MKSSYREIAERINKHRNVNIFKNTRQREVVEARAAFTYILSEYFRLGCSKIRDIYRSQGKNMNHATILHALKNWEIYVFNDNSLNDLVIEVMGGTNFEKDQVKINWIKHKLTYLDSEQVQDIYEKVEEKFEELCLDHS